MNIVIVIPTKNEANNLKQLNSSIKKSLKNVSYRLCFVDGSDNKTTIKAIKKIFKRKAHIISERKKNKISSRCYASRLGFKWAIKQKKCDIVVDMDSDLAHDPKEILTAIKMFRNAEYDLLISSKYLKHSKVTGRSFFRAFLSKLYTILCKIIINGSISDYSNSYRFYKKDKLKKLLKVPIRFKSPIQHLQNLKFFINNNYKIGEINCNYVERKGGNSAIKIKHLIFYFYEFVICLAIK